MIELENDIFICCNPADCTFGKNIARVHFKWQKISFLDDGSTGMLHHALLVQRKHSQDPECECFWRKTFFGQLSAHLLQRLESKPDPSDYSDWVDHYLVRFLPSFTTPRTNILDIRGQFSRIHLGLKMILDSEMGA